MSFQTNFMLKIRVELALGSIIFSYVILIKIRCFAVSVVSGFNTCDFCMFFWSLFFSRASECYSDSAHFRGSCLIVCPICFLYDL